MNKDVRPAAVAGAFYPGSATALAKTIAEMLADVPRTEVGGHIIGLVAPHAGYVYSGPVAAYAYKAIQGSEYRSVVVIAPCHVEAFPGAAVYDGDAYQIPFGEIAIDKELSRKIASYSPLVVLGQAGHRFSRRGGEHSLEVQLPFLKTMLGDFQLVAIVMGDQQMATCRALADAIAFAVKGRDDVLLVASTDLSHYHDYQTAKRLDSRVGELFAAYDYTRLYDELQSGKIEACGGGPVVAMMIAAEKLGADKARVIRYANSGDVTGDSSAVVGYLAGVVYRQHNAAGKSTAQAYRVDDNVASTVDLGLSAAEKQALLDLARQAIAARLKNESFTPDRQKYTGKLAEKRGAFVTLTIDGQLRGCIGHIVATKPLYETVAEMAVQAAFHDPRFTPLTAKEFEKVKVEISVLTPMIEVADTSEIVVGRDGLYISKGFASGLLLPQVPVEYGWDKETFLQHTCLKAGLPKDAWKQPGVKIQRFQAEIFGER